MGEISQVKTSQPVSESWKTSHNTTLSRGEQYRLHRHSPCHLGWGSFTDLDGEFSWDNNALIMISIGSGHSKVKNSYILSFIQSQNIYFLKKYIVSWNRRMVGIVQSTLYPAIYWGFLSPRLTAPVLSGKQGRTTVFWLRKIRNIVSRLREDLAAISVIYEI